LNGIVIDASVALAWCFPDEASNYADSVLLALEDQVAAVPAIWAVEVTNALAMGERRKRLRQPEVARFAELLKGLNIFQEVRQVIDALSHVFPLAQRYKLSAYDASYLDLAVRREMPLATLDSGLRAASRSAGVEIFPGQVQE
jgi:predicted nucleic acid-binding protein